MQLNRVGLLGLVALIIATTMLWKFLVSTAASKHPDSGLAQAAVHFV